MLYDVTLIIRNRVTVEAKNPDEAEEKAFELLDDPLYWEPPYDEIITEPTRDIRTKNDYIK